MKLKQFLKPDRRKIVVFVILVMITNSFLNGISFNVVNLSYGPWNKIGYPFVFLYEIKHFLGRPIDNPYASSWFPIGTLIIQETSIQILGLNIPLLILNLIIWYLLSCLIIWIFDKVKKK